MNFFKQKKPSKDLISKYEQMGFDSKTITEAWKECKGDEEEMMEYLVNLNQPKKPKKQLSVEVTKRPIPSTTIQTYDKVTGNREDKDFKKAIQLSLSNQTVHVKSSYEPLNPEQRIRPRGLPVGLKNVGNIELFTACYVNSLLQAYFMSETFVSAILQYDARVDLKEDFIAGSAKSKGELDIKRIRIDASIKLIRNLQKLFAHMVQSQKKYVDPSVVLESVVDDMGQKISVGDQRDITEYHLNFMSRIEEAFYYQEKFLNADVASPILIEDLPESYMSLAALQRQFQMDTHSAVSQENSVITRHFFGKMKQFMTFTQENEQVATVEEKEIIFGPVILDVSHRDLYTALENYCSFTVDDYRTPNGEITTAQGQLWITKPPELLFIQLNRVRFDQNTCMPMKVNKGFEFEKEIYLDRFLLDSREETFLINKRIAFLKSELERKENNLYKLMHCFEAKFDILKVFDFMENFLSNQQAKPEGSPSSNSDPTYVGLIDEEDKIATATDVIINYRLELEKKIQELKTSITTIKNTIKTLWGKLNKHRYHLVSILVHDGDAESGHYYSFNRNVQKDTWKRFNDYYVSEEQEEVVLTEALGGYAGVSAYCLVYLAEENIQEEFNLNTTQLNELLSSNDDEVEVEKHYYAKLLSPYLKKEVLADNTFFQDEVEEYKTTLYVKSVVENYKARYSMIANAYQGKNNSSPPIHLDSFGAFLKNDPYFESALKWYIVDTVLKGSPRVGRNNKKIVYDLRNFESAPDFFEKLQYQLRNLPKPFTLSSVAFTAQLENQIECKIAEYSAEFPVLFYISFILTSYIRENWKDSCVGAKFFLEIEKNQNSYLFKLVRDSTKVACLKLALMVEKSISEGLVDDFNAIQGTLIKGLLKPEDIQVLQVKTILIESWSEAKDKILDIDRERIRDQIQQLAQAPHVSAEIDKVIKGYYPEDLDNSLKTFEKQDLYAWRDFSKESPSAQLKKLVELFRKRLQAFVDFHNHISSDKVVLKLEDREKLGYMV